MAVITCPDCGNQYEDTLAACSACGRPNPALDAAVEAGPEAAGADAGAGAGYAAGGGHAAGNQAGGGYNAGAAGYGAAGSAPGHGAPPPQGGPMNIPNYLVQAILVTLCCCLPTGIVAIIKSTQVNTLRDSGNIAGAWEASKEAKKWCWISLGAGVVAQIILWVVWGAWMMAMIGMSAASNTTY